MAFFGPEADGWDAWAEEILSDVDHETNLGKQLARDAIRVTKGELTEEEFHKKYHESVLEEFGIDNRPTEPENPEN